MKLPLQKFSPSRWEIRISLTALLFLLTVGSVQAESPLVNVRPVAPGGIAIDWSHSFDAAEGITLERENPAFTWVFVALNNTFIDLGLQPAHIYKYRVCAKYAQTFDCAPWLAAQTLPPPPPDSPLEVPRFTNVSASPNSVTVNWESSTAYDFYQVRWAENGHGDAQNKVKGKSFTANVLNQDTGTYHFIIQGCHSGLIGSGCSRFSAPIEVSTHVPPPPPPPPPSIGVIYGVTLNDDLLWYRPAGQNDGSFMLASNEGKEVGTGWNFKQVFSGSYGVIYAITPIVQTISATGGGPGMGGHIKTTGGDLLWYRHEGRNDGSFRWASTEGKKVGQGWNFKQVFSGGDGVIYGIKDNGDLLWYRHEGRNDGSFRWAPNSANKVGQGWNFKQVFSGGNGVIYGTADNGDLLWYRHEGRNDGGFRWAPNAGKKVGTGWFKFNIKQIFHD